MTRLSTFALYGLLATRYHGDEQISIELVGAAEPAINVTMHDHGDIQIQVVAAGGQICVSTVLAPADQVEDRVGLNDACLRLNLFNPLSSLGIAARNGRDTYVVFGGLSNVSSIEEVDEEIRVLAANTIDAAESLKPYFA